MWKTIEVIRVKGVPHAYQQEYSVVKRTDTKCDSHSATFSDAIGHGVGVTLQPHDNHRLVPIHETLSDDAVEDLLEYVG